MCSEDQLFMEHHGFDLKAIEKAMAYNKRKVKICGASTISQQTAKMCFYGKAEVGCERDSKFTLPD